MNNRKKALLLGDYEKAAYHPLKEVDNELTELLKELVEIKPSEDYFQLTKEFISEYDLCILYVDRWRQAVDESFIDGLLHFMKQGRSLLVIHNGIALQSNERFLKLIGAEFTGHPEHTILKISTTQSGKKLFNYNESFDMDEEPYRFKLEEGVEKEIILEYVHDDMVYPAGWCIHYGDSKVVYLMPGHELKSFQNANFREIIKKTVKSLL